MLHRSGYKPGSRSHGESEKFEICQKIQEFHKHSHIPQEERVYMVRVRVVGCVWSLMRPLTFFKQEI